MNLALAIAAILFFILYLIFSIHLYNKKVGEKFNLKNHFAYELFRFKQGSIFSINILLFISLMLIFANNVVFAVNYKETLAILITILVLVAISSLIVISIIPLSKLKEHCLFAILFFISTIMVSALNLLVEVRYYKLEMNPVYLIGIIVDALIIIYGFICVFNPKLTNLNMEIDNENKLIRPKLIHLAFSEWLMIIPLFLTQVMIIVISMA